MSEFEDFDIQSLFGKNEFSGVLIKFDWDYRKIGVFLKVAETGRKVYAIVNDVRRALSFWKIPEWESYRDNFKIFSCEEEFQQYFIQKYGRILATVGIYRKTGGYRSAWKNY